MSSEIKTNTLSELTSANGVSIDGVNLKDSAINTGAIGSSVTVQAGSPIAVQLSSSASTSNTAQVDFNNTLITSAHKSYRIIINNVIPATNQTEPYLYFSLDNGSSFISSINSRRMFHKMVDTTEGQENQTGVGYAQIGTDLGNDANEGFYGHVDLFGVTLTTTNWAGGYANIIGRHDTTSYWWDNAMQIEKGSASAINFIRFKMSSGDLAEHDISLWGFK